MLQVSDAAMDSLKGMRGESPAPDDSAVRFYVDSDADDQKIGFAFGQQVLETDEKVADDGDLEVYVAPELVAPLSESIVDSRRTEQGSELFLRQQGTGGG